MGVRRLLTIGLAATVLTPASASAATLHGPVGWGKSGGIAGLVQRVTIRPDGSGFTKDGDARRNFQLSENRLGLLVKRVQAADIRHRHSPKQLPGGGHIADGMGFFVSYYGHTIGWGDGTQDPPAAVAKLYAFIDEIFTQIPPLLLIDVDGVLSLFGSGPATCRR